MPNRNNTNKNALIPLRRFAKEGQYNAAYLSLLVQRKKLKARRIGRKYYTTKAWFNEYLLRHARENKRQAPKNQDKLTRTDKGFSSGLFRVSFFIGQKVGKAKQETAKKLSIWPWVARLVIFGLFALVLAVYIVRFSPDLSQRIISLADRLYLSPAQKFSAIYDSFGPLKYVGSYNLDTKDSQASEFGK